MKLTDITPYNVRNFIEGTINFTKKKYNFLEPHIKEQAEYRQFLCKPCVDNLKCHGCTCKVPNLFYAQNKIDADKKWGPMVSKEEWETFKEGDKYQEYKNYLDELHGQDTGRVRLQEEHMDRISPTEGAVQEDVSGGQHKQQS
jgi:hypothetical protein